MDLPTANNHLPKTKVGPLHPVGKPPEKADVKICVAQQNYSFAQLNHDLNTLNENHFDTITTNLMRGCVAVFPILIYTGGISSFFLPGAALIGITATGLTGLGSIASSWWNGRGAAFERVTKLCERNIEHSQGENNHTQTDIKADLKLLKKVTLRDYIIEAIICTALLSVAAHCVYHISGFIDPACPNFRRSPPPTFLLASAIGGITRIMYSLFIIPRFATEAFERVKKHTERCLGNEHTQKSRNNLDIQIETLNRTIIKLKNEHQTRIQELELITTVEASKAECAQIVAEKTQLTEAMEQYKENLRGLQTSHQEQVCQMQTQIDECEKELETLKANQSDMQQERDNAQIQASESDTMHQGALQRLDELQQEIAQLRSSQVRKKSERIQKSVALFAPEKDISSNQATHKTEAPPREEPELVGGSIDTYNAEAAINKRENEILKKENTKLEQQVQDALTANLTKQAEIKELTVIVEEHHQETCRLKTLNRDQSIQATADLKELESRLNNKQIEQQKQLEELSKLLVTMLKNPQTIHSASAAYQALPKELNIFEEPIPGTETTEAQLLLEALQNRYSPKPSEVGSEVKSEFIEEREKEAPKAFERYTANSEE